MTLSSESRIIFDSSAEVEARNNAIDRLLGTPLITDFFIREGVKSEADRRYLVAQCVDQLIKRAEVETSAQRTGVLNSLYNPNQVYNLLNHTGFTRAYLRKLSHNPQYISNIYT